MLGQVNQLEVLEKSLSTLMVIFRGVSRMHGQVPSQDYEELTRKLEKPASRRNSSSVSTSQIERCR